MSTKPLVCKKHRSLEASPTPQGRDKLASSKIKPHTHVKFFIVAGIIREINNTVDPNHTGVPYYFFFVKKKIYVNVAANNKMCGSYTSARWKQRQEDLGLLSCAHRGGRAKNGPYYIKESGSTLGRSVTKITRPTTTTIDGPPIEDATRPFS